MAPIVLVEKIFKNKLSDEPPTDMPTDMTTDMPTGMPTDMPTAMPTDMPMLGLCHFLEKFSELNIF